jgi:hypothetical protein
LNGHHAPAAYYFSAGVNTPYGASVGGGGMIIDSKNRKNIFGR